MDSKERRETVNVIVIGGGVAGTTCASEVSTLARADNVKVTLIDPQSAIKVSSIVAKVTRTAVDVNISEEDAGKWCQEHGVAFRRDRVIHIGKREVQCESGARLPFTACCIATGARPYLPPVLSTNDFIDRVVTLRDTDSVESLRAKLARSKRAIIVGGGGIAMELVHEITRCEVVWVMKGSHFGSAFFDERAAECLAKLFDLQRYQRKKNIEDTVHDKAMEVETLRSRPQSCHPPTLLNSGSGVGPEWIARRFEPVLLDKDGRVEDGRKTKHIELKGKGKTSENGVQIVLNSEIQHLSSSEGGEWPGIAKLSDGSEIGCDLILAGTGVVPNTEWLRGSGIDVDWSGLHTQTASSNNDAPGGVLVSAEDLCTNVRGIFAAGDCTTVRPGTAGENWFQMRLWTQARASGRACAQSMAGFLHGEVVECSGLDFEVFAHATRFFSKKVVLLGRYNAQGLNAGYEILESGGERSDGHYIRAVVLDGRVRGALLVGQVDAAETFENLILDGLDVSRYGAELVDPSVDIDDYFD